MSAKIIHIQSKNRTPASLVADIKDFDYQIGESIDPKVVLTSSNISLYCLDHENQQAIFVETPVDVDIYSHPFLYQAQYDYAQRLVAVPYEDFHQMAEEIQNDVGQIIIIYSVGRCGSTLLSKIFHQLDTVLSLSEPDTISQMIAMGEPDGSYDPAIEKLLKSCIYLLAKPTTNNQLSSCTIKLRSCGIELADLIYHAIPQAKLLFMYRNAEDVVKSSIRAFQDLSTNIPNVIKNIEIYNRFIPLLKEFASYLDLTNDPYAINFYTIMWLSVMHRYLLLYQQNLPISALRYEDLVADPQQMVVSIFQYCNLPISEVNHACQALNRDSQDGSNLSWENSQKNASNIPHGSVISQKISFVLSQHPAIKTSDFIVPNTLGCS